MTEIKDVLNKIDLLFDEYMSFFKTLITHETYSLDKESIDSFVDIISSFLKKRGCECKTIPFKEAGNGLLVTLNKNSLLPSVTLCGHMDTVFPKGTFSTLYRIEGDKVFGPGVLDMKGGLLIGILSLGALFECGYKEKEIRFIFVPDEERSEGLSKKEGKDFIINSSQGSIAALTLEGSDDEENVITVGRKGSIRYKVRVQGVASHAGSAYERGRSAIKEASHKILDIESKSDINRITYNCGLISGGTSPNTVPEFCEFYLYNRYWNNEQYKELREHVEGILSKKYIDGTNTTFEVIGERYPMEAKKENIALAKEIDKISKRYGFGEIKYQKKNSGSDASYTSAAGVPSVCSLGPVGKGAHSRDEFCYISSIRRRAKLVSSIIVDLNPNFLEEINE